MTAEKLRQGGGGRLTLRPQGGNLHPEAEGSVFMKQVCTRGLAIAVFAIVLAGLATPAQAQFGGVLGGLSKKSATTTDGCGKGKTRSAGSSVLGSVLGSVAGRAASRAGVSGWVPIAGLTDQLTAAIACKLEPQEQKQAAEATLEATRGEGEGAEVAVGSSSAWTSQTRAEVSGTSTVIARNDDEDGAGLQCITVTDVIIVRGEETRADKRMCRQPPAKRYALLA